MKVDEEMLVCILKRECLPNTSHHHSDYWYEMGSLSLYWCLCTDCERALKHKLVQRFPYIRILHERIWICGVCVLRSPAKDICLKRQGFLYLRRDRIEYAWTKIIWIEQYSYTRRPRMMKSGQINFFDAVIQCEDVESCYINQFEWLIWAIVGTRFRIGAGFIVSCW